MKIRAVRGYTLIELAITMIVLGLIAVLLWRFGGLASQRIAETESPQQLTAANQALVGFVAANHRLPCPDTSPTGDGLEHCGGATTGRLPLVTLGLARADLRQMRYGVYRSAVANLDTAADRFFPLVTVAKDEGTLILLDLLSVLFYVPLDVSYHYGSASAAETPLGQVNGIDFCHALRTVSSSPADVNAFNIRDAGGLFLKNVAYALALPGARDADGDGNPFDASNVTADSFAAPAQPVSAIYDDVVQSVDFGQLFDRLSCAGTLAAADHAHFNAASAAALTHAGFVNYKSQLQLAAEIASANNLLAIAAVATATADLGAATAGISFAVAEALLSDGITAGLVAVSIFDETVAASALVLAMYCELDQTYGALAGWTGAIQSVNDFQAMLVESADLEISIRNNAIAADAAGLF